jgi:hypothetical protein
MNTLPIEKRTQIISLLVEGMSMLAVSRVAGCSINTVSKLLEDVGAACSKYQDHNVQGLKATRIQLDEIWAFSNKQRNVAPKSKGVLGFGDVYVWTGLDLDSKLMVAFMIGKRDADYAGAFILDVASRSTSRMRLYIDENRSRLEAVDGAFASEVDYDMLLKRYGPGDQRQSSHTESFSTDKLAIAGTPDLDMDSTSFFERQNTKKDSNKRRLTCLRSGFSKKIERLEHAVSLHFMHYNFVRINKSLRVTPAMEAGVADHVWGLEEIALLVTTPEAMKRGPYKPRKKVIPNVDTTIS